VAAGEAAAGEGAEGAAGRLGCAAFAQVRVLLWRMVALHRMVTAGGGSASRGRRRPGCVAEHDAERIGGL